MQRLFDFCPSEVKPIGKFFEISERCEIIRKYVGRGYFVATYETVRGFGGPKGVRRMYWMVKNPAQSKRLHQRRYTFTPVNDPTNIVTVL